jgi:hypothetical protein
MRRAASGPKARPRLRAVLYHHLTDHACSLVDQLAASTPPDVFEAHVRKIARDYEVVSLDVVLSGELPRRALLITFDDGYRSVAEVALPILRRLGLPSVFFVTGECLERDSLPLDNLLSHLSASVGLDRLGAALDPDARGTDTFPQLLDLVAAMPYGRRLGLGNELAERFSLDQARLREESGCSSTRRTWLDWRHMAARSRTTLARICSAGRSSTRHSRTTSSSSTLDGSSR